MGDVFFGCFGLLAAFRIPCPPHGLSLFGSNGHVWSKQILMPRRVLFSDVTMVANLKAEEQQRQFFQLRNKFMFTQYQAQVAELSSKAMPASRFVCVSKHRNTA